jgi:CRP/FNR family transcriptional regulator
MGGMHQHLGHPEGENALEQLVARIPLFSQLSDAELGEVARRVTPRSFPRNAQLYGAGEHNANLMIIHSGLVKVYHITDAGHEQVIRILGPGDFLGESTFIDRSAVDHFAVTLEKSDICALHHDDLHSYVLTFPGVAFKMLETLSRRLAETEHQLSSVAGDDADHRVATYLLEASAAAGTERIRLGIAKKDVASLLGLTPETFSRKLAAFEEAGWITLHRGRDIELLDTRALSLL